MKNSGSSGTLYVIIILVAIIALTNALVGGITPKNQPSSSSSNEYQCCDSGSGSSCRPLTEKQIIYNGDAYGLLKSNIFMPEIGHINPTSQFSPDGRRIFLNVTDTLDLKKLHPDEQNCKQGQDFLRSGPDGETCFGIPNDQIVYVCKASKEECDLPESTETTPFDAYFRIKDGSVPSTIANSCPKPENSSGQKIINVQNPDGKENLQLETFQVENPPSNWVSAWCKPAINLYPTQKTNIHVQVAPKGQFTLTIPQYPKGGWDVTAYPDGKIIHKDAVYPYLYWEASIPDKLITEPENGYSVRYEDLPELFRTLLPGLGLNEKETREFRDYWAKALPKAPYYFVGVMPEKEIDTLAPLSVEPPPDSTLRVALYFKAAEKPININPPKLSGFKRSGFTLTEWGGFLKADKNHPEFTCMM